MPGNIKTHGIVISSMPIGEYDKRIVLLTKEYGKISAFVRGARRVNSPLMGLSNAFIYGEFELYKGRSAFTVNKANAENYFTEITNDIDNMLLGTYFLEVANFYGQENADEKSRLLLLYRTLQIVEQGKMSGNLIKAIYEFRTMVINGIYPNLFECASCGAREHLTHITPNLEGIMCGACNDGTGIPVMPSTLYALQYVATSDIRKLFSFQLKAEIEQEFIELVDKFRTKYMNHEFKSLEFLKM